MNQEIADIRKDYKLQTLVESSVHSNPIQQFTTWWKEATESGIEEVNAMTLATSTKEGFPSARIVLLKGFSEEGFVFFTNYQSHKGRELEQNPNAALVFFWKELERQVRIEGTVTKISNEESDAYYQSRPEGSKIGAWASPQSEQVSRERLESAFRQYTHNFHDNFIGRPPHWGGYRVKPKLVEFWQGRPSRLHDRIEYTLGETGDWSINRLAP